MAKKAPYGLTERGLGYVQGYEAGLNDGITRMCTGVRKFLQTCPCKELTEETLNRIFRIVMEDRHSA